MVPHTVNGSVPHIFAPLSSMYVAARVLPSLWRHACAAAHHLHDAVPRDVRTHTPTSPWCHAHVASRMLPRIIPTHRPHVDMKDLSCYKRRAFVIGWHRVKRL